MADSKWKRVSARRYAVQVSLCMLTVYVSSYTMELACPTAMIWIIAPYVSLVISFGSQFCSPGVPASRTYCFITTVVLLYLDKAATAISNVAEPSFERSGFQHRAVHFALAFFVLSELEYHRQYFAAKGLDKINTSTWRSFIADADPTFDVSRQLRGYWYVVPLIGRSKHEPEGTLAAIGYCILHVCILDGIPFQIVGGCINYIIKRMVNPSPTNDHEIILLIGNANVFFSTRNPWVLFLNIWVLSRVIRQANFIIVWGIFRASSSVVEWWKGKNMPSCNGDYEKLQDEKL